jgi:hypothetical protein
MLELVSAQTNTCVVEWSNKSRSYPYGDEIGDSAQGATNVREHICELMSVELMHDLLDECDNKFVTEEW